MAFRPARPEDAPHIPALIYSAGPEIYDFIFRTSRQDALRFIDYEFRSGRGFCGYRNVTVATEGEQVIATGCFFNARQYDLLTLGTARNILGFYGSLGAWPVWWRSLYSRSVMKRPKSGELYLCNFAVHPAYRGRGVGTALIRHKLEEARRMGYTTFGLDVASTNPDAERLYQRLGLHFVEQKGFLGQRRGHAVPDNRKFELNLAD